MSDWAVFGAIVIAYVAWIVVWFVWRVLKPSLVYLRERRLQR